MRLFWAIQMLQHQRMMISMKKGTARAALIAWSISNGAFVGSICILESRLAKQIDNVLKVLCSCHSREVGLGLSLAEF